MTDEDFRKIMVSIASALDAIDSRLTVLERQAAQLLAETRRANEPRSSWPHVFGVRR